MNKTYTQDHLLKALREAANIIGEPLSRGAYNQVAPIHRWPASATIVKPFRTWQEACKKAGVKVNPARLPYRGTYSVNDCLYHLELCIDEYQRAPTYSQYCRWAADRDKTPSGPTIRAKIGWSEALKLSQKETL